MSVQIIIPDAPYTRQSVSLNGKTLNLEIRYIERTLGWLLSIYDSEDNPILLGSRIQPNVLLTQRFSFDNFIEGDIVCVKAQLTNEPLGRDNFGENKAYNLYYFTEEEL